VKRTLLLAPLLLAVARCGDDSGASSGAPDPGPYVTKCPAGTMLFPARYSAARAVGADGGVVGQVSLGDMTCVTESADGLRLRCVGPRTLAGLDDPMPRWQVGMLFVFRSRVTPNGTPARLTNVWAQGRDFDVAELYLETRPGVAPAQRIDATTPIGGLDFTVVAGPAYFDLNRDGRPPSQPRMFARGVVCGGPVSAALNVNLQLDKVTR